MYPNHNNDCSIIWTITESNFSEFDCPKCDSIRTLETWDYTRFIVIIIVIIVAIIGNVGVLMTSFISRSLRHTIDIYLANLAVADLFICTCCMPALLIKDLTDPLFILGPFVCKFDAFAQMTSLTCIVLTLSAISCDRFIAIMYPFRVRVTKQRTKAVITCIWIISMVVSLPFLFVRQHLQVSWRNFVENVCTELWTANSAYDLSTEKCIITYPTKTFYYTFVTIALFFVPIIIMSTAYALIIWRLWMTTPPGEHNVANIIAQHRAKRKVIKMVCIVLAVFFCCWAPLQIGVLYSLYVHSPTEKGQLPEWFRSWNYLATFVAYSNSALNPVIYGGFDRRFRQNLGNFLNCYHFKPLASVIISRSPKAEPLRTVTDEHSIYLTPIDQVNGCYLRRGSTTKTVITQETEAL